MAAPCHSPAWVRQQTLALSRLPHARWSPGGWLITVILKLQSWWAGAFYNKKKKELQQKWVRLGLSFHSERERKKQEEEMDIYTFFYDGINKTYQLLYWMSGKRLISFWVYLKCATVIALLWLETKKKKREYANMSMQRQSSINVHLNVFKKGIYEHLHF